MKDNRNIQHTDYNDSYSREWTTSLKSVVLSENSWHCRPNQFPYTHTRIEAKIIGLIIIRYRAEDILAHCSSLLGYEECRILLNVGIDRMNLLVYYISKIPKSYSYSNKSLGYKYDIEVMPKSCEVLIWSHEEKWKSK